MLLARQACSAGQHWYSTVAIYTCPQEARVECHQPLSMPCMLRHTVLPLLTPAQWLLQCHSAAQQPCRDRCIAQLVSRTWVLFQSSLFCYVVLELSLSLCLCWNLCCCLLVTKPPAVGHTDHTFREPWAYLVTDECMARTSSAQQMVSNMQVACYIIQYMVLHTSSACGVDAVLNSIRSVQAGTM